MKEAELATKDAENTSLKAKNDTLTATIASDSEQRGNLQDEIAAMKKQLAAAMSDEEAAQVRYQRWYLSHK